MWIKDIFLKKVSGKVLLTMDNASFHTQLTYDTSKLAISYFPPNTTCLLQPLDANPNACVKRSIRDSWTSWMSEASPALTALGNLKQPQREQIIDWVAIAWRNLEAETIRNSFSHCWPNSLPREQI